MKSSLGTLQLHQEIIATTYHSTIFELMYSVSVLIYVSMYLYSYPSMHSTSGLAAGGARQQFKERLKMTIE
jgi:hypothetical protein